MASDNRWRALLCAGVLWLSAGLGGNIRAAEVYPGCAQPGPTGKVWWVDPVKGKTPASGGLGTQAAPWNSLQGVVAVKVQPGYARPLLSSVPYLHIVDGKRVYVADQLGSPPVQPGDTIELMSGEYGDVVIGEYLLQVTNPSFVTVKAASGQTPSFSTLYIRSTNKWVFDGVKVQSLSGTNNNKHSLVTVTDQGAAHPTSDILLNNLQISTADSVDGWTKEQWVAQGRTGYIELGSAGDGTNGMPYTTCVAMTGSHIRNVRWGVGLMGNNSLFSHNELDHFGDDGIDYAASNISLTHNSIHDNFDIGDGNHEDAMQGQNGPLLRGVPYNAFSNILIDSNVIIRQMDPKLPFPTYLQGIDAFDEDWTNVTVTNNVVVTSACWGIFYASLHGGKIINNTVVADGLIPMPGNCKPAVSVGDKTHEGPSSSNDIIRNNIANGLSIYDLDPNMTLDHNICLGINGTCQIVTFVNGKPDWGVFKPGMHGDHNIIDGRGAGGMFVNFNPGKFVSQPRPIRGAPAIGAGNPDNAPSVTFDAAKFVYDLRLRPGARRLERAALSTPRRLTSLGNRAGVRVDVGAYQHRPGR